MLTGAALLNWLSCDSSCPWRWVSAFKRKHHPSRAAVPLTRGLRGGQMGGSQHLCLYHFNTYRAFCKWVACSLACSVSMWLMLCRLLGKTCSSFLLLVFFAPVCFSLYSPLRLGCNTCVPKQTQVVHLLLQHGGTCDSTDAQKECCPHCCQAGEAQSCQLSLGNEENMQCPGQSPHVCSRRPLMLQSGAAHNSEERLASQGRVGEGKKNAI